MLKKIGRYNVKSIDKFFYDGCHSIYIIEDFDDIETMLKYDWTMDDIYPIDELE